MSSANSYDDSESEYSGESGEEEQANFRGSAPGDGDDGDRSMRETSAPTTANLPVIPLIQRPNLVRKPRTNLLPRLTSSIYKYSTWHDVEHILTTGDELNCPRVRRGPTSGDQKKFRVANNCMNIHHNKRGAAKRNYHHKQTNWEEAKNCNLSYQELGELYQKKTFDGVLRRLHNVETLEVIDDDLEDMSHLTFNHCKELMLSKNFIKSFKHLPRAPVLEVLSLDYNSIKSYTGLRQFASRCKHLKCLSMYGCPVTFTLNYRQTLFADIPSLLELDGLPKQEQDEYFFPESQDELDNYDDGEAKQTTCTIL